MRPGDIVKVKLSGKSQRKDKFGIFLGTEKGGKDHLFRVFTGDRVLKLKRRSIQRMEEMPAFTGNIESEGEMSRFLKKSSGRAGAREDDDHTRLEMTSEEILRKVRIRDLWTSVVKSTDIDSSSPESRTTLDIESITSIHFPEKEVSKGQIKAIGEILEPCRRPGMPYFAKGSSRREFAVYSREEMTRVEEHINRLNDLKDQYVEWAFEDEEGDGGNGSDQSATPGPKGKDGHHGKGRFPRNRKVPKLKVDDPAEVELGEEEMETLDLIIDWAKQYFIAGGWEKVENFGLGSTPIIRLEKFSLSRYLEFFGTDLAGERHLETPSALLEVLLRLKKITWKEASEMLLTFKVTAREVPFYLEFPTSCLAEASSLPEEPDPKEFDGRKDLRDLECYTIDPPDARDFDDAVGFRRFIDSDDGMEKIELYVHIADVTHYVIPEHHMDDDARKRATSVYLPTGVLPMLPRQLSENLCSLRGGVDRLAFSTRMIFGGGNAELLTWEHYRSVIRVKENLSYDNVNEAIELNDNSLFTAMVRFSEQLEERSARLGIVTKERKIRFSDDGNELNVQLKSPSPATKMIEQFMVITNEAVARTIQEAGIPSVYRIHPLPDRTDVEKWNNMCRILGYEEAQLDIDFDSLTRTASQGENNKGEGPVKDDDVLSLLQSGGTLTLGGFGGAPGITPAENEDESGDQDIDADPTDDHERTEGKKKGRFTEQLVPMDPGDLRIVGEGYRKSLNAISKMERAGTRDLLYQRILSTMPRAVYSVNNHGHFGLNSLCYTHFTSPIRRYPDVLVHRILGDIIQGKKMDDDEKNELRDDLEVQLDICNDQSRSAEDMERGMIDVALATRASLDKQFRSSSHESTITGITPTSCFLSLDGATEGRVPLSRLSKHRLSADESGSRIILGRVDDEMEYARIVSEVKMKGPNPIAPGDTEGRETTDPAGEGDEREIELYRLGQKVNCSVHSVELSAGKVDLSMRS